VAPRQRSVDQRGVQTPDARVGERVIVYVVSSLWHGRRFTRALAQEGAWARIDENGIELWLAPSTVHPTDTTRSWCGSIKVWFDRATSQPSCRRPRPPLARL